MNRKEKTEPYVKKSISFTPGVLRDAKKRASELGHKTSFSAYVSRLIEADLRAGGVEPHDAPKPDKLKQMRDGSKSVSTAPK